MWVLVVVITTLTGGVSQTILSQWATEEACQTASVEVQKKEVVYAQLPDVSGVQYLCLRQDQEWEGYIVQP